ncbi:flagellar hook-length control protein FliK [Reinekea marina]|uniref:Flagellar hook-length control protein FliK n=1 Tax=Reinekea marina TaxID=1310421 RepID=A0ABV7WQ28_9GAMM|nr:flagellar hook-length control protein FliK [Reinekea marina]MDN3649368.1 flagellar hook-length control protein FliK [Reinekea marina]
MINLQNGVALSEPNSSGNPIISGGAQLSSDLKPQGPTTFEAAFQTSKSEQLSPPNVKKLAVAVLQANESAPLDAPSKALLSSLSSEELMQLLMTQSESSISTEPAEIPESLQEWIAAETGANQTIDPLKVNKLGVSAQAEGERANELANTALTLESESVASTVAPSEALNKEGKSVVDGSALAEKVGDHSVLMSGENSADAGVRVELETGHSQQMQSTLLSNEDGINVLTDDEKLDAEFHKLQTKLGAEDETGHSNVTNMTDGETVVQSRNQNLENKQTVKESIGFQSESQKGSNKIDVSAVVEPKAKPDSEIKPLSILVSSSEPKTTEELKSPFIENSTAKSTEKPPETKISDVMMNFAGNKEQEPDTTSLVRPMNPNEPVKIERVPQELPQAQALLQKAIKLPEVIPTLSDRIHTMIKKDIQHGFIRLDPPELGALEVRIQVTQETTQIQIVSQSPQVREALESQSIRLRESLAEQGLTLADLDVSDQSSQGAENSSEDGQDNHANADDDEIDSQNIDSEVSSQSTNGLVDHYV